MMVCSRRPRKHRALSTSAHGLFILRAIHIFNFVFTHHLLPRNTESKNAVEKPADIVHDGVFYFEYIAHRIHLQDTHKI